ncbi:hypothetical protein B0H19DRAFT_1384633 [Mycena capillaripes]|nr:hypothetical protein B0H19DRAFT_1384633 [Mycena capillaripes]
MFSTSRQSPSSRPSPSQGQLPSARPLQPSRSCATQPRLPDVTASPPSAARSQPSFTDATSLVVLKQRSTALKALEAGKARNSPPGSAARRRCFAERDASKLENGGKALGSTTCPRSPRRCFAERDARPLGHREALGAGASREPASTSGPGNRAEDAAPNPGFEYDLFLSFCANPVKSGLDEAITSDRLLERGDIVRADFFTSSLLPRYLEGRDPFRGVLATWRRYTPDSFCGVRYADTRTGATLLQPVASNPPTKAN